MKMKKIRPVLAILSTFALTLFPPFSPAQSDSLLTVHAQEDIAVDETNFPDDVFRNYILDQVDTDGSGALSQSEIGGAREFYLSGMSIKDLTGIGYFTELTKLICQNNQLTSLDVSQNTKLDRLSCNGNALTTLNVSQLTVLTSLNCQDNQLTSLDVSGCTSLQSLYCYNNQLTSLITGDAPLTNLTCHTNQLTSLDLSGNQALRSLLASNNQLASLDTSSNPNLNSIDCSRNFDLKALDLSKNPELTSLTAYQCSLSFLDLSSNTKLEYLDAFENYLIGVNLPENQSFDYFNVPDQWANTITPDTVVVDENYDFDLAAIAPGLDGARISNLKGAARLEGSILRSLTVTEPVEFTYNCGSGQTMDVSLNVYAANQWLRELSMEGWKYGEPAKQPTATARFGTAVFTYSDDPDGGYTDVMPSNAGTYYVKASVEATSSYSELESLPVAFEIAKGTPVYTIPTDLTAVEGDTLADVALPDGFSWQDPGTTSVGNPGENTFQAVYTPTDINYETVTGIELTIRVSAKEEPDIIAVDETNFSDDAFRKYILDEVDTDGSGALSQSEIAGAREFYLSGMSIKELTGIGHFTELTRLVCQDNQLTFLDLSSNTKLKYLDASENNLIGVNLPENQSFDYFRVSDQRVNTITPGTVAVDENYDFDLASIAPGLDGARISNLKGAVSLEGSILRSLTVTEPVEFTYNCGSGQTMDVSLNVYAANQWLRELSMEGWKYGETAKQPTATARFGTAVFTYSDDPDGGYTDVMPSNAGTYYVKASVEATSSYSELESLPVAFEIAKGTPAYTIPTDLTAVEGDTLADVALPDGFSWQDPGTTSVGNPGENTFQAVYTPTDINYETVTGIELTIRVSAKETAPGGTVGAGTDRSDGTTGPARTDGAAASVKTGDMTNAGIYTALLIASGALSVLLLCLKKKTQT